MKISRQKIIAISCALLLQLGLFSSMVHAVEHPFHANDELCASFITFGQQDLAADVATINIDYCLCFTSVSIENGQSFSLPFLPVYSSRAPPAS